MLHLTKQYYVVGYKGTCYTTIWIILLTYVPLQMVRAVGQDTFQPKIGFKTRYGLVAEFICFHGQIQVIQSLLTVLVTSTQTDITEEYKLQT